MPQVIDLTSQRGDGPFEPLRHPAGVTLPFEGAADASLIIPEIRGEIRSGAYDAEMISLLDNAVLPNDRVLVIGAGLGVLTTLIAKREGVERVIAVEANAQLVPYLERTHALNGVEWVETISGVLADGGAGYVPVFVRSDLRATSLLPDHGPWQQVMMVPSIDLELILAEEGITLIVLEVPVSSVRILVKTNLAKVERILLNESDDPSEAWEEGGVLHDLAVRVRRFERDGRAVLFYVAEHDEKAATEASPATGPGGWPGRERARVEIGPKSARISRNPKRAGWWQRRAVPETQQQGPPDKGAVTWGVSKLSEVSGNEAHRTSAPEERAAESEVARDARTDLGGRAEEGITDGRTRPMPGPHAAESRRAEWPGRERRRQTLAARVRAAAAGKNISDGTHARLWSIAGVLLLLAVPLMLVSELAQGRAEARRALLQEVEAAWGGAQRLAGPFLVIPVETRGPTGGASETGATGAGRPNAGPSPVILLPEQVEIQTEIETDRRARDGLDAVFYRSRNDIRFVMDPADVTTLLAEGQVARWDEAILGLGLSVPAGVQDARLLPGGDRAPQFRPGSGTRALSGIHARVGDPRQRTVWRVILELTGSRRFEVVPAGGVTEWRLHSGGAPPAPRGRFRPTLQQAGGDGFVAEWRVPSLAFPLPRAFRGSGRLAELRDAAFGVDLAPPLDLYRVMERATKLGFLLIAATFVAVLVIERERRQRMTALHYALIGAALCTFFLLLLPAAERIGFSVAYGLAAAAVVGLLTVYLWLALGLGARSLWVGAILVALYSAMYGMLTTPDAAFLLGSILAFLAVAAAMWATRGMGFDSSATSPGESDAAGTSTVHAAELGRRIRLAVGGTGPSGRTSPLERPKAVGLRDDFLGSVRP